MSLAKKLVPLTLNTVSKLGKNILRGREDASSNIFLQKKIKKLNPIIRNSNTSNCNSNNSSVCKTKRLVSGTMNRANERPNRVNEKLNRHNERLNKSNRVNERPNERPTEKPNRPNEKPNRPNEPNERPNRPNERLNRVNERPSNKLALINEIYSPINMSKKKSFLPHITSSRSSFISRFFQESKKGKVKSPDTVRAELYLKRSKGEHNEKLSHIIYE